MKSSSQTLFADDFYRINWVCDHTPKRILFTFMNWTSDEVRDLSKFTPGTGFGTSTARSEPVGIVEIISKKNDWYQEFWHRSKKSVLTFLHTQRLGHLRRLAYGSNMGAYGALAHLDDLHIDSALALSPQYEIDRDFDTRWKEYAPASLKKRIQFKKRPHPARIAVIYDPNSLDSEHADRIAQIADEHIELQLIQAPFAGHPVCQPLEQSGLLPKLVQTFSRDELSRDLSELNASNSEIFLWNKAIHLSKQNEYQAALKLMHSRDILKNQISIKKQNMHHLFLARLYRRTNQFESALEAIDAALALSPNDPATLAERKQIDQAKARENSAA